jgi:hypothetical protein
MLKMGEEKECKQPGFSHASELAAEWARLEAILSQNILLYKKASFPSSLSDFQLLTAPCTLTARKSFRETKSRDFFVI